MRAFLCSWTMRRVWFASGYNLQHQVQGSLVYLEAFFGRRRSASWIGDMSNP